MRTLDDIDRDIASTEARLRALHDERRGVGRSRNADIVAEFLGGKTVKAIAIDYCTTVSAIAGVLLRAGHTVKARRKALWRLEVQALVDRNGTRSRGMPQGEHQLGERP